MSGYVQVHWDGHHVGHAKLCGEQSQPDVHEIVAELVYLDDRRLPRETPQASWEDPQWVFCIGGQLGFRLVQSQLVAYKDGVYVFEEAVFRRETDSP